MGTRRIALLLLSLIMVLCANAGAPPPAVLPSIPVRTAPHLSPPASPAAPSASPGPPRKTIALTFDDGPSRYTDEVLAVLERHQVKATFCMLGNQAARYPAQARHVVQAGHQVCNHTRSHPNMRRLSSADARKQVVDTQRMIQAATGFTPTVFRFPYGASNPRVRKVVRDAGLRDLRWTVDTRDWRRPPASLITARIVKHPHSGDIVLMHDGGGNRSHTVESLDGTITQLTRKGYTFVVE